MRSNQQLVDKLARTETIISSSNCPNVTVYIDDVVVNQVLQVSVIEGWADVALQPYHWSGGRVATKRVTGKIKLVAR